MCGYRQNSPLPTNTLLFTRENLRIHKLFKHLGGTVNVYGEEWKCTEFIVVDITGLVSSGVDEFLRGFLNKRTQQRPSLQNDVKDWTKSTVANV